ncbi:GABA-specific permease [Sporothrix brasiliensis 5110]|uniref:GABA-specific permease n=1 Tax=Sporothrix brasiliensis 5110 TaxID=1398154 RepID=A0A0C2F2V6_9PEZI|nr:GABA-specific permease [Sporothrix brasiliensis 5110]KIH93214.1 GABA-specific permease [Sporothrix brasiliensis 5110]
MASRDVEAPVDPKLAAATASAADANLASTADAELLATLGYKQELKRNFSTLEVFGIAFSIMGLLPSIASTLAFSLPAGPGGMVWSWFVASGCIFVVGLAMADLGSAMPTSGGLYYWTHYYASPRTRNYLSFLVGYSNSLGLVGGLCSIDYGGALMFCSLLVIHRDGDWAASNGTVYAVFLAIVLTHGVLASLLSRVMNKLQTFAVCMNIALMLATVVALPVGLTRAGVRGANDGRFIFGTLANLAAWPRGWTFMLAWLSPIWTIGSFDACVHMSEEASNAAKAVPLGILSSIGMCWLLGFVLVIVIAACIDPAIDNVLGSVYGQPMAQIYYDALGKSGTLGFMSFLFIVQYLMGLSILVAGSRQAWAFSRDGALPFSSYLRKISKTFGYIPVRTIWACVFVAAVLGLLCLIAPAAASALFSLGVAGNNLAWGTPVFARVVWGQARFRPGAFYTGRYSLPIAWFCVVFLLYGIVLSMFPVGGPNPDPQAMNYTVIINMAVWGGASLYYLVDARKWFKGPKMTLGEGEGSDGIVGDIVGIAGVGLPVAPTATAEDTPSTDKEKSG